MAKFRVDTHLFRELGELLVGRESTALVELIKNAYDADATHVTVTGLNLGVAELGEIQITDNGTGMTAEEFEAGFLTVAGRTKDTQTRRSKRYRRKYTGAKGIGRLAAHKLARRIVVSSVARTMPGKGASELTAQIDWDQLERHELLDDAADAVEVSEALLPRPREHGTSITLSPLRRRWTERQRVIFLAEVQGFEPPELLVRPLDPSLLADATLFPAPRVRDSGQKDPGFQVALAGDFDTGEAMWQTVERAISWILDIDARPTGVDYRVVPTRRTVDVAADAAAQTMTVVHPRPTRGPFFQARILIREGEQPGSRAVKTWAEIASGVRVFMEGFRVLPYGERADDWLDIAAESTRRSSRLRGLSPTLSGLDFTYMSLPHEQEREGLSALAPTHYFGAVLLTEEGAPDLRMLVNREGFVPDEGFEALQALVRSGIQLSIRARAAASHHRRHQRRAERRDARVPEAVDITGTVAEVSELARAAREYLAQNRVDAARDATDKMAAGLQGLRSHLALLEDEQSLMRVVASVGMQMGAFVHELNGLVGGAKATEAALRALRTSPALSRDARREIAGAERSLNTLRQGLERQASFLTDVISADARRRRSRQRVAERFESAAKLLRRTAERRGIDVVNRIDPDVETRPMFPAELTTIFANLLTNAIKAAGEDGRVVAAATQSSDGVCVRIENTGVEVNLEEAERWFQPFVSTTEKVDALLGQGMGLGLPITRMMVEQYGGTVAFVAPSKGYASAVEVVIPEK